MNGGERERQIEIDRDRDRESQPAAGDWLRIYRRRNEKEIHE